jgi:hypothetical protein
MATVTALASHLLSLLQPPINGRHDSTDNGTADAVAATLTAASPSLQFSSAVPKVDAARLAFYHFLKNMCEPGEPLATATLDRFFRRAMTHAHWTENKSALFDEVTNSLQHFSNHFSEAVPLPPFTSASELQVVRAESFRTLERIVEDWVQSHQGPTDQIKIIRDRDEKIVVCRLTIDRALSVQVFDRLLCLRDGRLEPLTDDMVIHYTPELGIDALRMSQVEVAPYTIARFRNETMTSQPGGQQGIRGLSVRGFTFQKAATYEGGELHRHPVLFYPLKRIEQFFVNRATDPMYIELTGLLEKASDLLSQKHPESVRFAEAAMERGRLAFDQVFVDDRLLRLLLENLERALQLERRSLSSADFNGAGKADTLGPIGPALSRLNVDLAVDLTAQLGDKLGNQIGGNLASNLASNLGIKLNPGEEFLEPFGPDLVELQEAESCETIAPVNQRAPQAATNQRAPQAATNQRAPQAATNQRAPQAQVANVSKVTKPSPNASSVQGRQPAPSSAN